jgi:hypothetical protein
MSARLHGTSLDRFVPQLAILWAFCRAEIINGRRVRILLLLYLLFLFLFLLLLFFLFLFNLGYDVTRPVFLHHKYTQKKK